MSKTRQENTAPSSLCETCGTALKPVFIPFLKRHLTPACPCVIAAYDRQQAALQAGQKQAHIEQTLNRSGLGERFKNCTFDDWKPRKGTETAYDIAFKYAHNLKANLQAGRGYIMFGAAGSGKSHLAAAIVNNAISKGYTAALERVPKLLAKIRSTYDRGPVTESQIMKTLTSTDLLVLDDAGAEQWTRWTEPTLFTIIDERYSWQKALIITTNADLDGLEQKMGSRTMDRLLQMCLVVENRGSSYRLQEAHKRCQEENS